MQRILSVTLAGLLLSACGGTNYGGGGGGATCSAANATSVTTSIDLQGTAFSPSCAKTAVGTTLTFQNKDSIVHTATAKAGQPETFDSGNLNGGSDFSHTFNTTGTYHIVCLIHESMGMTMTLFVQ